jgi:hypothetical protein
MYIDHAYYNYFHFLTLIHSNRHIFNFPTCNKVNQIPTQPPKNPKATHAVLNPTIPSNNAKTAKQNSPPPPPQQQQQVRNLEINRSPNGATDDEDFRRDDAASAAAAVVTQVAGLLEIIVDAIASERMLC